MSLYNIIKKALLVLRKTFIKLLDKEFIRANSFSTKALIIFVKKFNKELRFCVDYRELNIIT